MIYRKLGSSGIDVSAVGFGAWAIGGWMWGGADENEAIDAIHAALDAGVNLIDTAPIYGFGRSEEIVGRAIRDRRDKVVLATKCGMIWDREEGEFFFHANRPRRHRAALGNEGLQVPAARFDPPGIGRQPQAARNRPRRSLPDALAGIDHADRRHDGRTREAEGRGQNPRHRRLQRQRASR